MIYDVTPVPRVPEKPVPQAKGPQRAARHRRQPDRFLPAALARALRWLFDAKALDLPRSGKSDIGSILFDNTTFQIESAG